MSLLPPENNVQIKQYKIISHQEQAEKDCRKTLYYIIHSEGMKVQFKL